MVNEELKRKDKEDWEWDEILDDDDSDDDENDGGY